MPVLLLLAHGALSVAPAITLSIPPPVVFKTPAFQTGLPKVESEAKEDGRASKLRSVDTLAQTLRTHRLSSFVDAGQPAAGPPAGNAGESPAAHEALVALNAQVKKVKEDMTALEDAHHQNQQMLANLEDAAKMDANLEQGNRAQINNLVKIYAGLNHQVVQEEHVQGTASALQQEVKTEAGDLVNAANEEDRELESTDQNRGTQKVQLDALTGTLFNKIQTGQAHHNTLTAWAMRVAFNTNVATADMEQLRGDLLTLDDTMALVVDDVLELFRSVQGTPKKAEV